MKKLKIILTVAFSALILFACNEKFEASLYEVKVQLVYPDGFESTDSVLVSLGYYTAYSDTTGMATFTVPASSYYTLMASDTRSINGSKYNFNASHSLNVSANTNTELNFVVTESSQLIIKEVYTGGCQKDDGSGKFTKDAYIIIYNNSDLTAVLDTNFCISFAFPYNSYSTNNYLDSDGNLTHDKWIPASVALWHFKSQVNIQPGNQIVFPVYQAIDHTGIYSNSVDLSNSEYYPLYDSNVFSLANYYTAPSEKIPTSHYLTAIKYGMSTAWSLSQSSPALFLFATKGMGPTAFATDASYTDYYGGSTSQVSQKVPIEWVIDGVDIFGQGYEDSNNKRFPDNIDAGSVLFTNNYGHTVYRNVDQEATEAIAENKGLIVYNYDVGTEDLANGSTDASGIDAEASIANGARIVYKDTNNSSNDFHQRAKASIK